VTLALPGCDRAEAVLPWSARRSWAYVGWNFRTHPRCRVTARHWVGWSDSILRAQPEGWAKFPLVRPGNQTRLEDRDRPAVLGLVEMNLGRKHLIMPFGRTLVDVFSPVQRHGEVLSSPFQSERFERPRDHQFARSASPPG
jgi:hypothetical protein